MRNLYVANLCLVRCTKRIEVLRYKNNGPLIETWAKWLRNSITHTVK